MAKDKQLTFLIEESKRDALKQHCADLGLTISQVLTSYVDSLLSGSVIPQSSTFTSTSTYNLDVKEVVNEAIDNHAISTSIKSQDKKIEDLTNDLNICFDKIDSLTKLIESREILKPTPEPKPSELSLEDTKQFVTIHIPTTRNGIGMRCETFVNCGTSKPNNHDCIYQ